MMRIMLIDDNPAIRGDAELLRSAAPEAEFWLGGDLYDADYYVYDEQIPFDLMIIDFSLGEYEFATREDQQAYRRLGPDLVGWIWIKRFLREHPDYDPRRIIGLSAYVDLLDYITIQEAGIRVIDKKAGDSLKTLLLTVEDIQRRGKKKGGCT